MKKILIFGLLTFLIAASLFAKNSVPGLKFGGYLDTGLMAINNGTTTNLIQQGEDSWTPSRLQLSGKYNAGNWGLALRLRVDASETAGIALGSYQFGNYYDHLYFRRAYGWIKGFDGKVKVQVGTLGDYTWASHNLLQFGSLDGDTGIQLQLMPIAGLNFGAFLPYPTYVGATPSSTSASDGFKQLAFGGIYKDRGLGYLTVGYSLGNYQNYTAVVNKNDPYFWLGLGYNGMPALTAKAEMLYELDTANNDNGLNNFFFVDQRVGYKLQSVRLTLWAGEQFNKNSSAAAGSSIFELTPQVAYHYSSWVFGGYLSYLNGNSSNSIAPGVWATAVVAKGAKVTVGGEYDAGGLAPATFNTPWYHDIAEKFRPLGGPYNPTKALKTQSQNQYRAYVNFTFKF